MFVLFSGRFLHKKSWQYPLLTGCINVLPKTKLPILQDCAASFGATWELPGVITNLGFFRDTDNFESRPDSTSLVLRLGQSPLISELFVP